MFEGGLAFTIHCCNCKNWRKLFWAYLVRPLTRTGTGWCPWRSLTRWWTSQRPPRSGSAFTLPFQQGKKGFSVSRSIVQQKALSSLCPLEQAFESLAMPRTLWDIWSEWWWHMTWPQKKTNTNTYTKTKTMTKTNTLRAPSKSNPRDLWPLRHLIRVTKRQDLTKKTTMTKTKKKKKTNTMTKAKTFNFDMPKVLCKLTHRECILCEGFKLVTFSSSFTFSNIHPGLFLFCTFCILLTYSVSIVSFCCCSFH